MRKLIQSKLHEIEKEDRVRILYACESGSRAWGFPSRDSDYDVRFVYVRPVNWYLSIEEGRDVIERPLREAMDFSGWDLKKALRLFKKSNPPLLEWFHSPIVYLKRTTFFPKIKRLLPNHYSPVACFHHYLHMAEGNRKDYLKGDQVILKKYLYILRPVLACQWIERKLGPVPMEFQSLVQKLVKGRALKNAIAALLDRKKIGEELDLGPKIPEISDFIDHEVQRLAKVFPQKAQSNQDDKELDRLFRAALKEAWSK